MDDVSYSTILWSYPTLMRSDRFLVWKSTPVTGELCASAKDSTDRIGSGPIADFSLQKSLQKSVST